MATYHSTYKNNDAKSRRWAKSYMIAGSWLIVLCMSATTSQAQKDPAKTQSACEAKCSPKKCTNSLKESLLCLTTCLDQTQLAQACSNGLLTKFYAHGFLTQEGRLSPQEDTLLRQYLSNVHAFLDATRKGNKKQAAAMLTAIQTQQPEIQRILLIL